MFKIKSFLSQPLAWVVYQRNLRWMNNASATQEIWRQKLLKTAQFTLFGKDHFFNDIESYNDFKQALPIKEYEDFKDYIDKIIEGQEDILWKGKPLYLSKTSGTTSGIKYIPITKESMPYHIVSARDALLHYVAETGKNAFLDKNMIFLSGSPELSQKNGIIIGRLSGIVNHHIPFYLKTNQLPTYSTNCIEDWESKIEKIIDETLSKKMALISGIVPWVQMYFDRIIQRTGKEIQDVFPDFSLLVYGGVNFEPYKNRLWASVGRVLDSIETYPASEGFIAYQDSQKEEGLLLLLNHGIFYEFIPLVDYFSKNPKRISLDEVEVGINYALILSTNAGLWGYSIGDTVKFVSKNPYRIVVTGRVKHFISAFGEHVIAEEIEKSIQKALKTFPKVQVTEFTVAPQMNINSELPYHEWFIEFKNPPESVEIFAKVINEELIKQNIYYQDLIKGKIIQPLKIQMLPKGAFVELMKKMDKLGGQNKVPRLSNDRNLVNKFDL